MKRRRVNQPRRPQLEPLEPRALLAGDLRIVEFNYHPHAALPQFGEREADADDFEFVEVMNVGDAVLNLSGYRLSEAVSFRFAQQFVNPGERVVVTKDLKDFRSRFGSQVRIALGDDGEGGDGGEYGGSLNNAGELVQLRDPTGQVIQEFTYYDRGEWPHLADGRGSSLEIHNPLDDGSDPKNWRASAEYGGSPGSAGVGFPAEIVINELLTHTDLPQLDAIELLNRTGQEIDMTGWYISDSPTDLMRFYRITGPSSIIAANDYRTYDENQLGFAFEGQEAEEAFLIEADAVGRPLRFVDAVSFSATQNGITLGRWPNGVGELFPMTELTFEDPNGDPLIGDVVISELHYHPPASAVTGRLSQDDLEFVELFNRTGTPLNIGQWRLRQAVDFTIPDDTIIAPGGTVIVLGFDPFFDPGKTREFLDLYGIPDSVTLLGPYSDATDPNADQLDDNGETLILERPEDPVGQLGRGYVLVDRVIYRDDAGWPTDADGQGASLTRIDMQGYGDFAATWAGRTPSPGGTGVPGDVTGDGLVDAADIDSLCTAIRLGGNNPRYDLNRDGLVGPLDFEYLIETILDTTLGDSNLDGIFNSSDLVVVFAAGQYEDDVAQNSGWASGDWNCDGDFTTADLVTAFQAGGYVAAAQPRVSPLLALARDDADQGAVPDETNGAPSSPDAGLSLTASPTRPIGYAPAAVDAVFSEPDPQPRDSASTGPLGRDDLTDTP